MRVHADVVARRACREQLVDYVPLDTRTPFDRALLAYLEKRARLL